MDNIFAIFLLAFGLNRSLGYNQLKNINIQKFLIEIDESNKVIYYTINIYIFNVKTPVIN